MENLNTTFIIKTNNLIKKHNNSFVSLDTPVNMDLVTKIMNEIPNSKLNLYLQNNNRVDENKITYHTDDYTFDHHEIFFCEGADDSLISRALSYGTICVGTNKLCNIQLLNNSYDGIVQFIRNPIRKREFIDKIYCTYNNLFYASFDQLLSGT